MVVVLVDNVVVQVYPKWLYTIEILANPISGRKDFIQSIDTIAPLTKGMTLFASQHMMYKLFVCQTTYGEQSIDVICICLPFNHEL